MIKVEIVVTLEQAQEVRLIRNECRMFMTGSTDVISREQQREFFDRRIATGEVNALLIREEPYVVAYGLLFPDEEHSDRGWLSAGVIGSSRGYGYGRAIIESITQMGLDRFGKVMGEARADNSASIRTCSRVGYRVTNYYTKNGVPMVLLETP
jgi:RimJ/RimL family protein N-acetyltransferase